MVLTNSSLLAKQLPQCGDPIILRRLWLVGKLAMLFLLLKRNRVVASGGSWQPA